jgi:hypothetical protein
MKQRDRPGGKEERPGRIAQPKRNVKARKGVKQSKKRKFNFSLAVNKVYEIFF